MNIAILRFYFSISVVMLVFLLFSFPFLEPGTGSMVIAKLTLAMLVPMVLVTGGLIYRETQKRPKVPIDLEDDP